MPEHSEQPPPSTVRDEALAWFVRLNSGDATAEQRAEFRRWQAADPSHRVEFEKLAGMWGKLEKIPDPRQVSRRRALKTGVGVVGAAVLVSVGYRTGVWDLLRGDYATGTGEIRTIALADGSQAELDADTALSVAYSEKARRIGLHRGRAMFTVAPDRSRPFSVDARNGATKALGTQFIVHQSDDDVVVTVLESSVSVSVNGSEAAEMRQATLRTGQQVAYGADGLRNIAPASQTEMGWRIGKLIFEDQSLRAVVSELNRYRHGRIVLLGSGFDTLRVNGIFNIRNPDGVLDAIARTLPVEVTRLTSYLVLIRPA